MHGDLIEAGFAGRVLRRDDWNAIVLRLLEITPQTLQQYYDAGRAYGLWDGVQRKGRSESQEPLPALMVVRGAVE